MANPNAPLNLGVLLGNNPGPHPAKSGVGAPTNMTKSARALLREKGMAAIPEIEAIIYDAASKPNHKIDAASMLLRYGIGDRVELNIDCIKLFEVLSKITAKYMPSENFDAWFEECLVVMKDGE